MSGALVFSALCLLAAMGTSAGSARASFAFTMAGTLVGLLAALGVLLGPDDWEWTGAFLVGGERMHLRLDGVGAIFLVPVCVIGAAGAAYARAYWPDSDFPGAAARGRAWWNALILCMGLVLTISNGLHFLIAWEAFALCGYFLITLDNRRPEVRKAGWLYLASSHAGTLALMAFFTLLAAHTGTWELGPVRDVPPALFWLALFGFGMKAGFFPCHIWLPSAHANAPSHVSAVMSGVAIKMGVYGIVRFGGWLPVPAEAGQVVIGLGAASAVLGIAFAMAQNDLKRLLAYCSVENIGVILIGLGAAQMARTHGNAAWGQLAIAGALLHVWNHALFKSLLFFGAGSVLHATGTREMSRLGGLGRAMPWTAGLFALGAAAVCGLPPLNGFVGEWLIYLGLFDAATTRAGFAWAVLPAAILLASAGALALAAFIKAGGMIFLGAARTKPAAQAHECGAGMLAPMGVLAAACAVIGLAPGLVWPAIARAAGSWNPAWAHAEKSPFATLGPAQAALAALAAAAGFLLWKKSRANGLRRGLTWDCGYRSPAPRMQYTSGSFAGIVAGWFFRTFGSERKFRRPHGPFPEGSILLERIPETVLERWVEPAGAAITRLSHAALSLQHGRLQAYILYLVVGLAAVGALVFLEGKP
ncbi:MAG: proton-conducting transporter membrane subunit [Verrucomicrobiae bacterium]